MEGQNGKRGGRGGSSSSRQPNIPMPEFPFQANNSNGRVPPSPSPPPRPKPAELIERYVAQGMDKNAASEKVIEDLQAALQRSLYPMQRLMALDKSFRSTAAHIDSASERLHQIEAKLDSKPNLAQVFVAGVAAGAFLQTAAKATPAVVGALSGVYGNIKRTIQG